MHRPLLILCLALAFPLGACDGPTSTPSSGAAAGTTTDAGATDDVSPRIRADIGETVAIADGVPIGMNEFLQLAGRKLRASEAGVLSPEDRRAVVDELADQKILYREALRRGYDKDPKVQRLMVQLLLQDEVYDQIKSADLTDEDLRSYFERHREEFVIPEKIRLRRIFVKAEPTRSAEEARALIDQLHARVTADLSQFARVAAESSEGPYRGRGGDLGLIGREPRPGVPQEIIERGFAMKQGEVSAPFELGGGWNILFASERRDRVERTFEQMRGAVVRRAKAEKNQQAYEAYIAERRKGIAVQVFDEKLDAVRLAGSARPGVGLDAPEGPETPSDTIEEPTGGEE